MGGRRLTSTAARAAGGGWRALTVSGQADRAGTVPVRPLTMGDLLDEPFVLIRAHLRSVLLFAAAAVVPVQLAQGYLTRGTLASFDASLLMSDPESLSMAMAADGGGGAVSIVLGVLNTLLVLPIAVALVSRLAVSSVLGESLSDGEVLRAVRARLPALAGTWVLALMAVALAPGLGALVALTGDPLLGGLLIALSLPISVAALTFLAPAPLISVVEHLGPLASLRRSATLVRPRFWRFTGALSLALLVSWLLQMALAALPSAVAFLVPGDNGWILASSGSTLAGLIGTPYTVLVIVLLYLDALVRGEALDVQRLLDPPTRGPRAAR
jgi:hypothetical protein